MASASWAAESDCLNRKEERLPCLPTTNEIISTPLMAESAVVIFLFLSRYFWDSSQPLACLTDWMELVGSEKKLFLSVLLVRLGEKPELVSSFMSDGPGCNKMTFK